MHAVAFCCDPLDKVNGWNSQRKTNMSPGLNHGLKF